jgi:hypothetical protein
MRYPSARMTPNLVTPQKVAFGQDKAGGRVAQPSATLVTYPAAVQPTSAEDVEEHHREQGAEYFTVKVYQDLGLRVRDQLVDELGRVHVVVGVLATSGGAGRTWRYLTAHRASGTGAG